MRILERMGNDRVVMILGVLIGLARGTNYIFLPGQSDLTGHLLVVNGYMPVWSLGLVWYVAGILSLCALFVRRLLPLAYGVLIGMASLSALLFFSSWILGYSPSGFVSTVSYIAKAVMIYLLARTPQYDARAHSLIESEIAEARDEDGTL